LKRWAPTVTFWDIFVEFGAQRGLPYINHFTLFYNVPHFSKLSSRVCCLSETLNKLRLALPSPKWNYTKVRAFQLFSSAFRFMTVDRH